jgi:hypothetical protein
MSIWSRSPGSAPWTAIGPVTTWGPSVGSSRNFTGDVPRIDQHLVACDAELGQVGDRIAALDRPHADRDQLYEPVPDFRQWLNNCFQARRNAALLWSVGLGLERSGPEVDVGFDREFVDFLELIGREFRAQCCREVVFELPDAAGSDQR